VLEVIRLHRSRGRSAAGRTLLEGPRLLGEAAAAGASVETAFVLAGDDEGTTAARSCGAEVVVVSDTVLRRLGTTENPQSPVAVFVVPEPAVPDEGDLLVCWGVGDPGNAGTLLRTAAAFGFGFVAGPGTAEVWSPKVLRAAAGAHFHTTVGAAADPATLRGRGRALLATVPAGGEDLDQVEVAGAAAVLVGDEAAGLPADVTAACDRRVTIPMPGGTESLNAAVAGALVAYHLARRRERGTGD
jgi:TrmH family RNA methyltransferase